MASKALLLLLPASVAVAVASQWREISRYVKMERMSSGGGHPENVPVEGVHAYPSPGAGEPDGTGEFDSGSRGGPQTALVLHADRNSGQREPGRVRERCSTPSSP
jgi:hypothetical protein